MGPSLASAQRLEDIEVALLLEGVERHYGYDFRSWARAPLKSRIDRILRESRLGSCSELQDLVLHDPAWMDRLLHAIRAHPTRMYRHPAFYRALRRDVLPLLRTWPFIRIWYVGCWTGEDVYALAIALAEEGVLGRARIFATDLFDAPLRVARSGTYAAATIREFADLHDRAGGTMPLGAHYLVDGDRAVFSDDLRENIVFSRHVLGQDVSFNEFHLILCRDQLIYFGPGLKERALGILADSLAMFGVLGVGELESLRGTRAASRFCSMDETLRLYRRIA